MADFSFSNEYRNFYNECKEALPDILTKENNIPESEEKIINFFIENWYPNIKDISKGEICFLEKNDPELFPDIKFSKIFGSLKNENKKMIFVHLHNFYLKTYFNKESKKIIDKIKVKEEYKYGFNNFKEIFANILNWNKSRVLENTSLNEKEDPSEDKEEKPVFNESFFKNSKLGKMAKEISDEIDIKSLGLEDEFKKQGENLDPSNLLKSLFEGGEKKGMGKLVETVINKVKNKVDSGQIKKDDIMKEAVEMMKLIGGSKNSSKGGDAMGLGNIMKMAQQFSGMKNFMNGVGNKKNKKSKSRKLKRKLRRKLRKQK